MGPLEARVYHRLRRQSASFRRNLARLKIEAASASACVQVRAGLKAAANARGASAGPVGGPLARGKPARGSPMSRPRKRAELIVMPVPPDRAVAALLFARMFDQRPDLLNAIRIAAPTIVIDVADPHMLAQLTIIWKDVLFDDPGGLVDVSIDWVRDRTSLRAAYLFVTDPTRPRASDLNDNAAVRALQLVLPLLAISPMATSYLPEAINRAASARIDFPKIDATVIARAIEIVTGSRCRTPIDQAISAGTSLLDLVIAVRFDRASAQCVGELGRLAAARNLRNNARDLTLSELHGLGEARAWAESTIADIVAWKAGRIPWSQLTSGVALNGPPGCGKTTFAQVFCREAGLHLVSATYAKWQGSGDGHLGHLLRSMRRDFEEARNCDQPSCIFIDEIDSFANRANVTHAHHDYVVNVVNALLAEIDGIKGREGLIVIGASNDISRCDPALLRSGRLERIVQIGVPNLIELERMFRVRLKADLQDADLTPIIDLSIGLVGADVERVVKDARRVARQDGQRPIELRDLREALAGEDNRPTELLWRHCVHEAAHLLVDVIHFGPEDVFATSIGSGGRGGMSVRTSLRHIDGTPDQYHRRLQVILAGRAGEQLLLGSVSHGAGGRSGSDLDNATSLAAAMVGSLGLVGANHLTFFGAGMSTRDFLQYSEVRVAVARELRRASEASQTLLEANREALLAVATELQRHGKLDGVTAASIIERHRSGPIEA
jgi:AAA+ superfamily predicted ATPase